MMKSTRILLMTALVLGVAADASAQIRRGERGNPGGGNPGGGQHERPSNPGGGQHERPERPSNPGGFNRGGDNNRGNDNGGNNNGGFNRGDRGGMNRGDNGEAQRRQQQQDEQRRQQEAQRQQQEAQRQRDEAQRRQQQQQDEQRRNQEAQRQRDEEQRRNNANRGNDNNRPNVPNRGNDNRPNFPGRGDNNNRPNVPNRGNDNRPNIPNRGNDNRRPEMPGRPNGGMRHPERRDQVRQIRDQRRQEVSRRQLETRQRRDGWRQGHNIRVNRNVDYIRSQSRWQPRYDRWYTNFYRPRQVIFVHEIRWIEPMPVVGVWSYYDAEVVARNLEGLTQEIYDTMDRVSPIGTEYGQRLRRVLADLEDAADQLQDGIANSYDWEETIYDLFNLEAQVSLAEQTLDGYSRAYMVDDEMKAVRYYVDELLYTYRVNY